MRPILMLRLVPRLRRPAAMVVAVALLAVVGPALAPWSAAPAVAQTGETDQPTQPPEQGVPPPADMSKLPSNFAPKKFDGGEGRAGIKQLSGPVLPEELSCVEEGDLESPTVTDTPRAEQRMRVDDLHQYATGVNQKVAVIDTGINRHPRLADRLSDGGDYILNKSGVGDDCDGHGTIVAGIIAASAIAETGFTGVAPAAEIISIRQTSRFYAVELEDQNQAEPQKFSEQSGNTTTMARAVMRAIQLGANVINISAAACVPTADTTNGHAPDLQAAIKHAFDKDVVVVVAAGNADEQTGCANNAGGALQNVTSPAWFDEPLTVGAVDSGNDRPAEFSVQGPWVDVAAPGTAITSLDPAQRSDRLVNQLAQSDGEVKAIQGTSFAAPYVAGLAALVRERFPDLTAREVVDRIERTAQQAPGQPTNWATGHGVVDPIAALTAMIPEEHETTPTLPAAAPLEGMQAEPVKDPFPTKVAIVGAAAGLGLLGLTMFIVYAVHRHRRRGLAS